MVVTEPDRRHSSPANIVEKRRRVINHTGRGGRCAAPRASDSGTLARRAEARRGGGIPPALFGSVEEKGKARKTPDLPYGSVTPE